MGLDGWTFYENRRSAPQDLNRSQQGRILGFLCSC